MLVKVQETVEWLPRWLIQTEIMVAFFQKELLLGLRMQALIQSKEGYQLHYKSGKLHFPR